jgi:site-specific recombinase XerD
LRAARVLCQADGSPLSADRVKHHVERAARGAKLNENGVHQLRHTFCSHLSMRGAPARAIQDVAGHQGLTTTQRYMHLSPAAIEGAIRLLEHSGSVGGRGEMLETEKAASDNSNR